MERDQAPHLGLDPRSVSSAGVRTIGLRVVARNPVGIAAFALRVPMTIGNGDRMAIILSLVRLFVRRCSCRCRSQDHINVRISFFIA